MWAVGLLAVGLSPVSAEECVIGDPDRQAQALATFELSPADLKSLTGDLNNLRAAAIILDANGQLGACVTVAEAMEAIVANPTAIQDRTRAVFAAASPIAPAGRPTTARDLLGQRVVGLSGRPVAEIDDLWLAGAAGGNFALLSVGGFFGIGADHVAVPLELLRVDAREVFYVGLTTDDLAAAPRFASRNILSDPTWLEQNSAFYEPLVEQLTVALTN
jgi:hypothetical protein